MTRRSAIAAMRVIAVIASVALLPHIAAADAPPPRVTNLAVSWEPGDVPKVSFSYDFTGHSPDAGWRIEFYADDVSMGGYSVLARTGSDTIGMPSLTCFGGRGSHTLKAIPNAGAMTGATATTTFETPPPSITGFSSSVDAQGYLTVTIGYNFPFTHFNASRLVSVSIGGTGTSSNPSTPSGSVTWTMSDPITCWRTGDYPVLISAETCPGGPFHPPLKVEQTSSLTVNSTPDISVSYSAGSQPSDGQLSVGYNFPNTTSPGQRWFGVSIDGTQWFQTNAGVPERRIDNVSGTWTIPVNTVCWPTGNHPVEVRAIACNAGGNDESYTDRDETVIAVNTKPDVSLSASESPNGDDTLTVSYDFPNTTSAGQRFLELFVDGASFRTYPELTQSSGSIEVPLGGLCWQTARAVARACGRTEAGSMDEDETRAAHHQPTLKVAAMKSTKPGFEFEAQINYDFRKPVAGRYVEVSLLSWTDADGQTHPASGGICGIGESDPLSGTKTCYFNRPDSRARHIRLFAILKACGEITQEPVVACDQDCPATSNDPVYFADGNMRLTDTDPLPRVAGHQLTRTYDSDEQEVGLFGRGFTTLFEQRLMRDTIAGREVATVVTATNELVTFERVTGGSFHQKSPRTGSSGTLVHDPAAGTYTYRAGGGTAEVVFRSDGKVILLHDRATAREARIGYTAAGLPETLTDSWTGLAWTLTVANRRVTSIAVSGRPDLTWSYEYDAAGNLTRVLAPGGAAWRTYEYAANRLTASRDADGKLIESHAYDGSGWAIDSTGPGDEIQSIQYNLPGSEATERVTRVAMKTGAVTDYIFRPSGGGLRVVQILGACAGCGGGAGDRTYVRDADGRSIREQGPDGFITARTYDGDRIVAEERHLRPAGCDPQTDAARCRMTTDQLASASLSTTAATVRTTYLYGDPNWPERPTAITTPSVAASNQLRQETIAYHPASGSIVGRTITGFAAPGERIRRGESTILYEARSSGGGEDGDPIESGLTPAFAPGGVFRTDWLALPQPALLPKSADGPRDDAEDVTSFVYYPIDPSVTPPLLRGRLAATRNAAGHITRYEGYDEFGNVTRVVDPNGVATELTYDALGRLKTSTIKGTPGCDPSKDALCTVDLTTTWTYSPAGPLQSEQRPGGGITAYAYDERGRVHTISRGPSSTDLRERIETAYDPLTGSRSVERRLAYEGGTWVEKTRQSFAYTALGELKTVTHADGANVEYTYDAAGRLAKARDENHAQPNTEYSYDAAGRLETVRQALSGTATGWITTRYTYDIHGNLISVTDPNGNITRYTFDDFGQMIRQQSPVTGTTSYGYDAAGNLTHVKDANGIATVRSYDALGRLTAVSSGAAGGGGDDGRGDTPPPAPSAAETVTWTYDDPTPGRFGIGRPASMADPAGVTRYDYERRGLLTREERDPAGCMRDANGSCEGFTARTFVTVYRYDRDGNRSSIHYPSNKLQVNYTFDHAGRPLTASGAVTAAQYLPFGPLRQLAFDNGTLQTLSYDSRYRLRENVLTTATRTLARYVYRYDAAGNITAIDDALEPVHNRTFAYDDLHRLVTADTGPALWQKGSYTWDAMGNPLAIKLGEVVPGDGDGLLRTGPRIVTDSQWRPGGRTLVFSYADTTPRISRIATNANPPGGGEELLRSNPRTHEAASGTAVTYDAAGNETGYFVTRTYSPRNLLQQVTRRSDEPGDTFEHKVLYAYDGRGIRVVRAETPSDGIAATARRYYFYTPELKLLSVTRDDAPNLWTAAAAEKDMKHEIIWFGDRPVAQVPLTGGRSWTFTDHLGTPILQTDSEARVTWHAEHEPFGHIFTMRTGDRGDQPLRFPGQELAMNWEGQEENYNVFRWYRGGWGRYTQNDPIDWKGTLNPYSYGAENPVRFTDPLGKAIIDRDCARRIADELTFRHSGDGREDALRHCIWNCRMTRECSGGRAAATLISEAYEIWYSQIAGGQGPDNGNSAMDRHNNRRGRSCAYRIGTCESICAREADLGGLITEPPAYREPDPDPSCQACNSYQRSASSRR